MRAQLSPLAPLRLCYLEGVLFHFSVSSWWVFMVPHLVSKAGEQGLGSLWSRFFMKIIERDRCTGTNTKQPEARDLQLVCKYLKVGDSHLAVSSNDTSCNYPLMLFPCSIRAMCEVYYLLSSYML
jgi:hypothetical protein